MANVALKLPVRANQIRDQGARVQKMKQEIEYGQATGHARDFFPEQPKASADPSVQAREPASGYGQERKRINSIKKQQKSRQSSPTKGSPRKQTAEIRSYELSETDQAKFNEGLEALNDIHKRDLQELKAFNAPPQLVKEVFGALLTLLQKPEDWDTAKKEMKDPIAFVQGLKRFDLTSVPAKNLKRCKSLIKEFDMTFDNVKR